MAFDVAREIAPTLFSGFDGMGAGVGDLNPLAHFDETETGSWGVSVGVLASGGSVDCADAWRGSARWLLW